MADIALRGNKLTAGRTGFGLGSAVKAATKLGMKIVKGKKNLPRMDQAQRLKDYHRKTKILKGKASRIQEGKSKAFHEKYIKSAPHETKVAISRSQHPKSWKRAGKSKGGRIGFSRAGPVGNLPWVRGTSRPGVKKAPRGAEHKKAIKQEKEYEKLTGSARKTGNIKNKKGEVIGSRIAKAGSKKAMGNPRAPMTKGDYAMKNLKKRMQKTPNKPFRQDKTYKLYAGPGKTKTHGKIISGKAQKKKIVQEQIDIKRSWDAKGDKWGPYKGGWR